MTYTFWRKINKLWLLIIAPMIMLIGCANFLISCTPSKPLVSKVSDAHADLVGKITQGRTITNVHIEFTSSSLILSNATHISYQYNGQPITELHGIEFSQVLDENNYLNITGCCDTHGSFQINICIDDQCIIPITLNISLDTTRYIFGDSDSWNEASDIILNNYFLYFDKNANWKFVDGKINYFFAKNARLGIGNQLDDRISLLEYDNDATTINKEYDLINFSDISPAIYDESAYWNIVEDNSSYLVIKLISAFWRFDSSTDIYTYNNEILNSYDNLYICNE